ncbi:MAG TPA: alpha-2-macroglobulin, partial [Bacteroidetes bacterium]|nr:alpha-2-macroglobulin [Bacteroidota bacterium]
AGDGEADEYGMRLNPVLTRRTEADIVSVWSGVIPTQGGQASITIDIPAFAGALRVMAVAWKDEAFGSAEKSITVADPVVLDIGAPRAMSPGDSLVVPVIVTNTTKKSGSITTNLKVDGPVRIVGSSSRSVTVDPSRDVVVDYTIVATGALGVASLEAEAKGLGEVQRRTTSVPVRPISPLTESSEWGSVTAGKTNVVNIGNGFFPGTSRATLVVTSFPAPNVLKSLDNLLGYPYGCVEQTISKAFPQIYLADLSKVWNERLGRSADPVKNVREAVRKVESMQSYNGGVSYWPGGTDVSWWGTAYAVHFLSEAQKAGYDVDKKVQQKMLDYLERRAKSRETEGMRVPSGDGYTVRPVAAREVFYSLFVLASMGRQDVPTMNYYRSSPDVLSQDSRYVLACTYLMLGDRATYDKLVPKSFTSENYRPFDGGSFASPRRDLAFALLAMVHAAPNDPKTAELAKRLSDAMRGGDVWSTQENAFAVLALGKLANKQIKAGVTCTVTENGKKIATLEGAAASVAVSPGRSYSVSANGGTVYWYWSAEGIPTSPRNTTEDVVLKVRRQWLTRDGKPLTSGTVRQNDIIIVKVTVMSTDRVPVRNVVISDVLPGGCELENPRLGAMDNTKFASDGAIATYYDYRDDRMNFFVNADTKEVVYYYTIRAVNRGKFAYGPIGADAMYDAAIHSYSGGGALTIN